MDRLDKQNFDKWSAGRADLNESDLRHIELAAKECYKLGMSAHYFDMTAWWYLYFKKAAEECYKLGTCRRMKRRQSRGHKRRRMDISNIPHGEEMEFFLYTYEERVKRRKEEEKLQAVRDEKAEYFEGMKIEYSEGIRDSGHPAE